MGQPGIPIRLAGANDVLACRQYVLRLAGAGTAAGQRFAATVTEVACAALLTGQQPLLILTSGQGGILARLAGIEPGRMQRDLADLAESVPGTVRLEVEPNAVTIEVEGGSDGAAEPVGDPVAALRGLNRELLAFHDGDLVQREEVLRLGAELEDTNRGVLALYAELDDRAEQLRAASELKTRFLSNVSHEFRTPLNSILALCRLLLSRVDGPLAAEQEQQVTYILTSAVTLSELVNDLLDLAKVEVGRLEVQPRSFCLPELFNGLHAVMRPLRQSEDVELVFEEPPAEPALFTDDVKVSQILRNLVSNALKFTERGEVRVRGAFRGGMCVLTVADTGIGIDENDRERVFEEFTQISNALQGKAKGTGLGLSLSRRLANLLGGSLTLMSEVGVGSTFTLTLPCELHASQQACAAEPGRGDDVLPSGSPRESNGRRPAVDQKEDAG